MTMMCSILNHLAENHGGIINLMAGEFCFVSSLILLVTFNTQLRDMLVGCVYALKWLQSSKQTFCGLYIHEFIVYFSDNLLIQVGFTQNQLFSFWDTNQFRVLRYNHHIFYFIF